MLAFLEVGMLHAFSTLKQSQCLQQAKDAGMITFSSLIELGRSGGTGSLYAFGRLVLK